MDFINLPTLVLDAIFKNLNASELKTVRTTCRTLNFIVNQPKYLKIIKTHIKNKAELEDIVTNCNELDIHNVIYDLGSDPRCKCRLAETGNIKKFIEKFKSTLTHVKLASFCFKHSDFVEILSEGAHLESLSISDDLYFDKMLSEILKSNTLANLKKLKIKFEHRETQRFIEVFLQKCPNLNHIRLPIWQTIRDVGQVQYPESCEPLINFVQNRTDKLTIDFGGLGCSRYLEVIWMHYFNPAQTNRLLFPITPTILLQLCQNSKGLKLRNVQLSSLPNKTDLTDLQMSNLDACIESIVMIRPDQICYSRTYFPTRAEIKLGICEEQEFKFDPKLNITSIHCLVEATFGVKNCAKDLELDHLMYQNLFENNPTKLLELYIAQGLPIYVGEALVNFKLDVCPKLPSLKAVYLFAWRGFNDYNYTRWQRGSMPCKPSNMLKYEF